MMKTIIDKQIMPVKVVGAKIGNNLKPDNT